MLCVFWVIFRGKEFWMKGKKNMSPEELLQIRLTEHTALLQRLVEILEADQRIVAAWLFGSRGNQTADALSDTDLWVVVKDESIEAVVAERRRAVALVDQPLLLFENPRVTVAGGAYLMVLYPGQAGMHQVDWYWQRQSDASLPQQAILLLNRGEIPQDTRQEQLDLPGSPLPLTPQDRADRATALSLGFWSMSNIAVKSIMRHHAWKAVSHLEVCRRLLDETRQLLGERSVRTGREEWRRTVLPPVQRDEQMAMLREIAQEMEHLTPAIEAIGGLVPSTAIPSIYDFFALANALLQQEENR
jgi:predicted nucleotidyltransferase